jgi:hypothetical protein
LRHHLAFRKEFNQEGSDVSLTGIASAQHVQKPGPQPCKKKKKEIVFQEYSTMAIPTLQDP